MSSTASRKFRPEQSDEDLKRAVAESLDTLDREGKLAVLEFSRNLGEERRLPNLEAIRLIDEWIADESGYAEETWPELEKALDRDRIGYRSLFE
jgi:hypothetical protein